MCIQHNNIRHSSNNMKPPQQVARVHLICHKMKNTTYASCCWSHVTKSSATDTLKITAQIKCIKYTWSCKFFVAKKRKKLQLNCSPKKCQLCSLKLWIAAYYTRSSSGDETANVNFLYNDIVRVPENTINSRLNSATDLPNSVLNSHRSQKTLKLVEVAQIHEFCESCYGHKNLQPQI